MPGAMRALAPSTRLRRLVSVLTPARLPIGLTRLGVLALLLAFAFARPASAQQPDGPWHVVRLETSITQLPSIAAHAVSSADNPGAPPLESRSIRLFESPVPHGRRAAASLPLAPRGVDGPRQPKALVPLYFLFGTLQALDYHSTRQALSAGTGRESNPLARSIVSSRTALFAAKAGATAAVIAAGEKLWKRHRIAAVLFVAGLNGAMAAVVAHNYAVSHR